MHNKFPVVKILFIISLLAILTFYVWIRIENSQFIREPRANFGDTHEFLDLVSVPILSRAFWISLRPPLVPLLYKIVGTDYQEILKFQLWLSIFSWSALGLAVLSVIKSYPLKIISFLVVLGFSLSAEIILWDYLILGSSIAVSTIALFSTSALLLLSKWSSYRLFTLIAATLFFAFARDDFTYYILMASFMTLTLLLSTKQWKRILTVSAIFFFIFFIGNTLSSASLRWYRPLLNTLSMRILPNPQYRAYFEARGMPIDENPKDLQNWAAEHGKQEFIRFLWFHKADTLQSVFHDFETVFSPNVRYYAATRFRPIIRDTRIDEFLFPMRFGFLAFLAANILAATCSVIAFYEKKAIWLMPIALILLAYPQAVLVWNADAYEIARHSIFHNIMLRLGMHILILFVLDFFISKLTQTIQQIPH
ncbi:MAG: hypothetical protein ACOYYU_06355 [Chloroflexota bacterium]